MINRDKLTDARWDEAFKKLISDKLEDDDLNEPTDEEVWELLATWHEAAEDEHADQIHEQRKDERYE